MLFLIAGFHSKGGLPVGDRRLSIDNIPVEVYYDSKDSNIFYYMPRIQLSKEQSGAFKFLLTEWATDKGDSSGGVLHAVFELRLNDSIIQSLKKGLEKKFAYKNIILKPIFLTDSLGKQLNQLTIVSEILKSEDKKSLYEPKIYSH